MKKQKYTFVTITRFIVILLFMASIYLLCTEYMYMTYNGAFNELDRCEMYTKSEDGLQFENTKKSDSNVIAGVLFRAAYDVKQAEIAFEPDNEEAISKNLYLHTKVNKYDGSEDSESVYDREAQTFSMKNIKKGDEVTLMVMDDSGDTYLASGEFLYNNRAFDAVYVYNTNEYTMVAYSAFDLLFGSESMDNMNFSGNPTALIFWLPPIIALLAYIFDRKSYVKNFIGMICSVVSIFAVVNFIGGARLAMGSMLSILLNLLLFLLCFYPMLLKKKEE